MEFSYAKKEERKKESNTAKQLEESKAAQLEETLGDNDAGNSCGFETHGPIFKAHGP